MKALAQGMFIPTVISLILWLILYRFAYRTYPKEAERTRQVLEQRRIEPGEP
jgi:hypothetical protein